MPSLFHLTVFTHPFVTEGCVVREGDMRGCVVREGDMRSERVLYERVCSERG